jgi:hypothetical protein
MVPEYKIELSALRYARQAMDFVHKHGEDCSNHHLFAMIDDIKRDHGEDAPDILARMGELLAEQADRMDGLEAFKRLKHATGVFVPVFILVAGLLMLPLHHLPMQIARTEEAQYEVVAVLCVLALLTQENLYWIAALLLAVTDIPDFRAGLSEWRL